MNVLILFLFIAGMFFKFSDQNELSVVFDLFKELNIRQCVLVSDTEYKNSSLVLNAKTFSSKNIACTILNYAELIFHVDQGSINCRMAMVMQEKDLNYLETLTELFDKHGRLHKFSRFIWLIFLKNFKFNVYEIKFSIPYNCEFIIIQTDDRSAYKLTGYYTVKNNSFIYDFGEWNDIDGLVASNISFYWRKLNLNGSKIISVGNEVLRKDCNEELVTPECVIYVLMKDMSRIMNFDHEIIKTDLENWVRVFQESGDIFYDLGPLTSNMRDKLGPIFKTLISWYIKHPRMALQPDYFIKPFYFDVWLALILTILVGGAFITTMQKLIRKKRKVLITDHLFLIFEILCNQCGAGIVNDAFLRVVCIASGMIYVVLAASFGAVISSYLTVEMPEIPFTTVEEFLNNGRFKLLLENNSYADAYFKARLNNPIFKHIYHHYSIFIYNDPHRFWKNPNLIYQNNLKKICDGENLAFFGQDYVFDGSRFKRCEMYRIPKPLGFDHLIMPLRRFSPFMDMFNHNLLRFYEYGIQKKLQDFRSVRWSLKHKVEDPFRPVQMNQMILVFSIPVIGILIAVLIVVAERIHKNRV